MTKKSLNEKEVEQFLLLNPDFLSKNSHILNALEIVHETGGAVSLIQKQVELLRENYNSTSNNLLGLIEIAKNNENIFLRTKDLILDLILCKNAVDIISLTERRFEGKFQADKCKLIFFRENTNLPKGRVVDPKEAHGVFGKKYNAVDIYCGPVNKKESDYIFKKKSGILECVLVPLKSPDCPGLLALGSKKEGVYSKDYDSMFLEFIAQVLANLIERNNY